ncbi:thiol:disulfide interchange protein [Pseudazoarcus pumilus]|uniref:Thiol:disulfide interchange protein DsbD n=2 Tax=Pseudazoarcus pumilus TaxID=2067960 RepID=A0A2I6S2U0_9RHOO|nr:protein-disulfide reductase DsbD [Pseudazoarcus pumilus]AUN93555.1 thiol:disulfide interchange protein [Pseudazoarcus pumilus]
MILFRCFALLLAVFFAAPSALADPVEPEKAFPLSARMLTADTVELRFDIRRDYYLYDDKLGFAALSDGVTLGTPEVPPGETYEDEFFGGTVIHRGRLDVLVPVSAPADMRSFELEVKSQGCWDGGICYPPETRVLTVALEPATDGGGDLLGRALSPSPASSGQSQAAAAPARTVAASASGDESGRIARLLGDASPALVLASFFGFGLLLAFTPCTFPMIPILSGIIVGQGHHVSHARAGVLSLAFVLGMAVTYAAAGVAAGLSGTLLAAALQNVWVLGSFAVVFVLLALSMFGFYELQMPSALQSRLSSTASHQKGGSLGGVVTMGVLSALIVGPCVAAPLAGALLYIAQTGDAVLGGAALFVMALGMGAPLIAVGVGTRSLLPRIGPWMEGVKKAFGVMLLAVALWLISPVIPAAATMLGWALLLGFSGIFLHALDPLPTHAGGWRRFWKGLGVMLLIAGAAMLIGLLAGSRDPLQPLSVLRSGAATQVQQARFERVTSVAELQTRLASADRPVMLDFYADWCVSCKEMERFTFSDPAVAERMSRMLLLKADVTANNDADKALLARFDLFGPPGIVFFDPDGREIDGLRVVGFMRAGPFGEILDRALN